MSDFNFTAAAVTVVNHERKSARLEGTYDAFITLLGLNADTASDVITTAARGIVVTGANNDGTVTGKTLTEDMLTGRDPGADATHRDYWKAARTVRIGLVNAIKRADDSEPESKEADYLAAIIKAVDNGVTHNLNAADIAAAVNAHVESLLS